MLLGEKDGVDGPVQEVFFFYNLNQLFSFIFIHFLALDIHNV